MAAIPAPAYQAADFDTGQEVRLVDGEHDVFGDGTVACIPTPGHTAGHQSLRVRTADRAIVLTADACYFRQSLETSRLPRFGHDRDEQLRSFDRLRALEAAGAHLVLRPRPRPVARRHPRGPLAAPHPPPASQPPPAPSRALWDPCDERTFCTQAREGGGGGGGGGGGVSRRR